METTNGLATRRSASVGPAGVLARSVHSIRAQARRPGEVALVDDEVLGSLTPRPGCERAGRNAAFSEEEAT